MDAEGSSSAITTRTPLFVTNTPTTTILRSGATASIQRAEWRLAMDKTTLARYGGDQVGVSPSPLRRGHVLRAKGRAEHTQNREQSV
jgi:hypothetical protein